MINEESFGANTIENDHKEEPEEELISEAFDRIVCTKMVFLCDRLSHLLELKSKSHLAVAFTTIESYRSDAQLDAYQRYRSCLTLADSIVKRRISKQLSTCFDKILQRSHLKSMPASHPSSDQTHKKRRLQDEIAAIEVQGKDVDSNRLLTSMDLSNTLSLLSEDERYIKDKNLEIIVLDNQIAAIERDNSKLEKEVSQLGQNIQLFIAQINRLITTSENKNRQLRVNTDESNVFRSNFHFQADFDLNSDR